MSLPQLQAYRLPVSATFLLLFHCMHAYAKMPKAMEESSSDVDVTNQLIPSVALGTSLRDVRIILQKPHAAIVWGFNESDELLQN